MKTTELQYRIYHPSTSIKTVSNASKNIISLNYLACLWYSWLDSPLSCRNDPAHHKSTTLFAATMPFDGDNSAGQEAYTVSHHYLILAHCRLFGFESTLLRAGLTTGLQALRLLKNCMHRYSLYCRLGEGATQSAPKAAKQICRPVLKYFPVDR